MGDRKETVTRLLAEASGGSPDALGELMPLVYEDLRALAEAKMRRERANHTLQATALVHEAYMRLVSQKEADYKSRSHFLAVASMLMRRILVDHQRAHKYRVPLDEERVAAGGTEVTVVDLDASLKRLESVSERMSKIVEMRFFGGMSFKEIAAVLEVSTRQVRREWTAAKILLLKELKEGQG